MLRGNISRKLIQRLKISLARKSFTEHRVQYFHFQIGNHPRKLIHDFRAPPVRANDGCKFQFGTQGICQVCGVNNIGMGADMDRRRSHDQRSGINQGDRQLANICDR